MNKKEIATQIELLNEYKIINPYYLDESGFKKIEYDILESSRGFVHDEYLDFLLWYNHKPGRQEAFLKYLKNTVLSSQSLIHVNKILEIGCGKNAWLAKELSQEGYKLTCVDPILPDKVTCKQLQCYNYLFDYEDGFSLQLVKNADLVLAQEPCGATEHIIRACEAIHTPYYIVLCGIPHRRCDQIMPQTVWEWYDYLQKCAKHGKLEKTKISNLYYYVIYSIDFG